MKASVLALALLACACHAREDRNTARELTGGEPSRGRARIQRYGCGACHEIPGVSGANGMIGPPLGTIADRMYLAGQLPNNADNMIRWIREPQTVESGTAMPNLNVTEADARDIAAYLYAQRGCCAGSGEDETPSPSKPAASPSASLEPQDRDFLERASQGSTAEIAIGTLTANHALRPEVIAFGRMLIADHTAANTKLAAIAAAKHISLSTSLGDHQQSFDRLADEQLDPFDHAFATVMVDEHTQAVELFRGEATNGSDPALKAYAAATLPTLEAHLAQAKALATAIGRAPQ
jgi:predicted outer membrane protein/cytochrome c2